MLENVVPLKVLALQQLAVVVGVALLVTFISSSSPCFHIHDLHVGGCFENNLLLILLACTSFHENNNHHHSQVGGCFMLMIGLELGFGSFTF